MKKLKNLWLNNKTAKYLIIIIAQISFIVIVIGGISLAENYLRPKQKEKASQVNEKAEFSLPTTTTAPSAQNQDDIVEQSDDTNEIPSKTPSTPAPALAPVASPTKALAPVASPTKALAPVASPTKALAPTPAPTPSQAPPQECNKALASAYTLQYNAAVNSENIRYPREVESIKESFNLRGLFNSGMMLAALAQAETTHNNILDSLYSTYLVNMAKANCSP